MTDSKTPDWVKEAFIVQSAAIEECRTGKKFVLDDYPFVTGAARAVLDRHISQALLSAYERGRAGREWQPIETAPKEGMEACRPCMGSGYGGHPDSGALCHACGGAGGVMMKPEILVWREGWKYPHNAVWDPNVGEEGSWENPFSADFMDMPTHWMPLPAPPAIRQLLEVKG